VGDEPGISSTDMSPEKSSDEQIKSKKKRKRQQK